MAAGQFCVYYLLKCLYYSKEAVIISTSTLIGTVAALTASQMLIFDIPRLVYYSNKSLLDLPDSTREQQEVLIVIMYLQWTLNLYFSFLLLTLTQKQKKFLVSALKLVVCQSGQSGRELGFCKKLANRVLYPQKKFLFFFSALAVGSLTMMMTVREFYLIPIE